MFTVSATVNPEVAELVLNGKFDWDKTWHVKRGKKIIKYFLVYRDHNKLISVTDMPTIEFNKPITIWCDNLLILTYEPLKNLRTTYYYINLEKEILAIQ